MRTPIIAANWKMHKTVGEAVSFAEALVPLLAGWSGSSGVEVVVAAPFTCLAVLRGSLDGTPVRLAAQNLHAEAKGAFTGEVSGPMLVDVGCSYVIIGHSERRSLFGETSEMVARKAQAAQENGLRPIVCVGETLWERESGRAFEVIGEQIDSSLDGLDPEKAEDLVVAYEPVWAIGTGRTATPEIAQEAHAFIRKRLSGRFRGAAARIRIQYGGSVKPGSIAQIMAQPDIDGALVGGASLDPASFFAIIRFEKPPEDPAS